MSAEDDWEALAESSEALEKVVSSNPNFLKHADEDKVTEIAALPTAVVSKPKQPKKVVGEEFDKKQKAKPKAATSENAPTGDSIADKLRRQKMEEDADHELADELFEDVPKVALDSEDSYKQYALQVSGHLGAGVPHRIPGFLKELVRGAGVFLTSAHLLDVSQTLTALLTEKQKTNTKPTLKGVSKKASAQDFGSEEDLPEDDGEFEDFM